MLLPSVQQVSCSAACCSLTSHLRQGVTSSLGADVTSCEPDIRVSKDAGSPTPDDPAYVSGKQWDMPIINTPAVWAQKQYGSKNINVCMVSIYRSAHRPGQQARTQTCSICELHALPYVQSSGQWQACCTPRPPRITSCM